MRTEDISTPVFLKCTRGKKRLTSPFAKNFDREQWIATLKECDGNARDIHLCMSAAFFGQQVSILRRRHIQKVLQSLSKRSALTLAVGSANRHYFSIREEFLETQSRNRQSRDGQSFHLLDLYKEGSQIAPQKNMPLDDLMTAIVDALPHWFYESKELSEDRESLKTDFGAIERNAASTLSIEAALGNLWMSALWERQHFKKENENLVFGPADKDVDAYWFASHMRAQSALLGPIILFHDLPETREDTKSIKIVSEKRTNSKRVELAAEKPAIKRIQRLNETLNLLENSYLADFLDEPMEIAGTEVTIRLLTQALWLIAEFGSAKRETFRAKTIRHYKDAKEFSLRVPKGQCISMFRKGLDVTEEVATSILYQLSLSPDNTSKCFADGVWLHPLIELDDKNVMIVMPSTQIGAPIRFAEKTLAEVLGPDLTKVRRLGANFETNTRQRIQACLKKNTIIVDATCLPHAFDQTKFGGEEIDLLLRIGRRIIVGELKCLISPSEPIDRFNHLSKIEDAAEQAKRKSIWLSSNLHLLNHTLEFDNASDEIEVVPLVVLNVRVGSGLDIEGVAVTDVSFLEIFCRGGSYSSGSALAKGRKAVTLNRLYSSQEEAEAAIPSVFSSPPPLKAFIEGVEWTYIEFHVAFGKIFLETPALKDGALISDDLREAADRIL